jgi:hypothetical protein
MNMSLGTWGRRCALVVLASSTAGAWSLVAHADNGNAAAAEALFAEARRLAAAGDYPNACPKFAESERLDPSVATLLNLGACYEKAGRTASAWATFREAISAAQAARRDDYLSVAQKRAAALEPLLPRLVISEKDTTTPGIEIQRDGVAVTQAEWGVPIPVDPGEHVVAASAPGKKRWETEVTIAAGTPATTVDVAALEDAPAAAAVAGPAAAAPAPMASPPPPPPSEEPHDSSAGASQRTAGVIMGGAGIVGLAVGTAFVLSAKSKYDSSLNDCVQGTPNVCNAAGVSERNSARTSGDIASVAFGVGIAAVAGGVVLWFTAPSGRSDAARVGLVPTPGGAFLRVEF